MKQFTRVKYLKKVSFIWIINEAIYLCQVPQ